MAPLPAERVQVVPAFTNISLDFMGPLYLRAKEREKTSQANKAYVCIFVCEDTRAIHLELRDNITTDEFLQAYRRMVNRRGMSSTIHSDNQSDVIS